MADQQGRFMTHAQELLSAEQQALFADIMRWASLHQLGPAHTAEVLVQVARAMQRAILHLDEPSIETSTS
jgi:hypothetical protein